MSQAAPIGYEAGMSRDHSVEEDPKPVLETHSVSKRFGGTLALTDVDLAFYPGEIHCVLGENGAGKSTLSKILGGAVRKDSGELSIDGKSVNIDNVNDARRSGIAVVFQELSVAPDLSIRANLVLGTELRTHPFSRLRIGDERKRVQAVLAKLQLTVDMETNVGDLPLAQQQQVEVAKALIREPKLLVLDEPTAMLSAPDKQCLFDVLKNLRDNGMALLLITHHIEDVVALGDRVSILRNGRVVHSCRLTRDCDTETILEKISGRRTGREAARARRVAGGRRLNIHGVRDRDGELVEMTVARGEILGLYGVAGCGAATIARVIVGLAQSRELSATMDGIPLRVRVPAHARKLGIAYLPTGRAHNGILPDRSIRENLNLSLLKNYSRAGIVSQSLERAGTIARLEKCGVTCSDVENNIAVLSGGNQQKILLARTLGGGDNLVVLEDPTAGIDINTRREIQDAIRARAAAGVSIILISSDIVETLTMVDTLYTMYSGAVVRRYAFPDLGDQAAVVADIIGRDPYPQSRVTLARNGQP